jgi:hypothetical protein
VLSAAESRAIAGAAGAGAPGAVDTADTQSMIVSTGGRNLMEKKYVAAQAFLSIPA